MRRRIIYSEMKTLLQQCRFNRTKYFDFWKIINWSLPDTTLSTIWGVDRGNIRARRVRLHSGSSRWRLKRDAGHPVFLAAIGLEKLKSKKFSGPKPTAPHTTVTRNQMSIPTEIRLELLSHNDEGVPSFRLGVELLNSGRQRLSATIEADNDMQHPQVASVADDIGLQDQDRQVLLLAAYEKMVRYHGTGPTGGTIQLSRWVTPDISSWVRRATYQPASGRILRTMRRLRPAGIPSSPIKEFTESLEGS
jgi:hypothetical protein